MIQKSSKLPVILFEITWVLSFAACGCGSSGASPTKYTEPNVDALTEASAAATLNIADPKLRETTQDKQSGKEPGEIQGDTATSQSPNPSQIPPEILHFPWHPPRAPAAPYRLEEPEDQHTLVIFPGAAAGKSATVLVGFHGQPQRDKPPRDYKFPPAVINTVSQAVARGDLPPLVLVLPVFRFRGQNWPGFDIHAFRAEIERLLAKKNITPKRWLVFGHSGAAGCGGQGLNEAHRMHPDAVGFFDTCLGPGWSRELQNLGRLAIPSVSIHSVETAGFRPRQRPEYQHLFDFGRAYGPAGLVPVSCPSQTPGPKLRVQKYRCAATKDGLAEAYVVDSGTGQEAHEALLPVALTYFLERYGRP